MLWKGKVELIGILFMKIMENKRKGRSKVIDFHEKKIEEKIEEIE